MKASISCLSNVGIFVVCICMVQIFPCCTSASHAQDSLLILTLLLPIFTPDESNSRNIASPPLVTALSIHNSHLPCQSQVFLILHTTPHWTSLNFTSHTLQCTTPHYTTPHITHPTSFHLHYHTTPHRTTHHTPKTYFTNTVFQISRSFSISIPFIVHRGMTVIVLAVQYVVIGGTIKWVCWITGGVILSSAISCTQLGPMSEALVALPDKPISRYSTHFLSFPPMTFLVWMLQQPALATVRTNAISEGLLLLSLELFPTPAISWVECLCGIMLANDFLLREQKFDCVRVILMWQVYTAVVDIHIALLCQVCSAVVEMKGLKIENDWEIWKTVMAKYVLGVWFLVWCGVVHCNVSELWGWMYGVWCDVVLLLIFLFCMCRCHVCSAVVDALVVPHCQGCRTVAEFLVVFQCQRL